MYVCVAGWRLLALGGVVQRSRLEGGLGRSGVGWEGVGEGVRRVLCVVQCLFLSFHLIGRPISGWNMVTIETGYGSDILIHVEIFHNG